MNQPKAVRQNHPWRWRESSYCVVLEAKGSSVWRREGILSRMATTILLKCSAVHGTSLLRTHWLPSTQTPQIPAEAPGAHRTAALPSSQPSPAVPVVPFVLSQSLGEVSCQLPQTCGFNSLSLESHQCCFASFEAY